MKQIYKFVYCVLYSVCSVNFGRAAVIKDNVFRLDIVHYNDFHDRFEETTVSYPVCSSNDTQCLGGFARLYYGINMLLKEKPDALLLNAGDTYQGTYWYTLLKWNLIQKFINMLPNDAHAIGNHEFDDGVAGLVPYLAGLKGPVVAANMDTSKEPTLNGLYKPHVIVEKKGKKIGIIGLITPDTASSSSSQGVIFKDPIETARKEAEILTEMGVDIVVVLSHCGLEVDMIIAKNVGENIDIIVGGHSHSLLWNGQSPSNETISGPYPVIVKSIKNPKHNVLVVTASAFTKYLGNITTYFNHNGELLHYEGSPVFLNRSIPEDANIKALLKPHKDYLDTIVNEVVGYSEGDLLAEQCGTGECEIGDFIADSLLDAAKQKNVSDLPHVVLMLRNMIRGSIEKGDINRGAIINTLPFTNRVMTGSIQGKYLLEALARTMVVSWVEKPFNGPWMPHVAGLNVTLNTTDKSIVSVYYKDGDDWKPLEPDSFYQIVTLSFLTRGGNGFSMVKKHIQNLTDVGMDAKILEKYITKISPFTPALDKRLTVVT